jgi:hypothetical protein
MLATAIVVVLALLAAWAMDYPPGAVRSAGRSGFAFVAKHAADGANPRLASRGQRLPSNKLRAREVLRWAVLIATGLATTPSALFRIVSLVADRLRHGDLALPWVRAPPIVPRARLVQQTVPGAALLVGVCHANPNLPTGMADVSAM